MVRTALQLGELLTADKHQDLHLMAQALMVTGDLVVIFIARRHHH